MAKAISSTKEKDEILPDFTDGQIVELKSAKLVASKTKPPARMTEGALLVEMENAAKYLEDSELKKVLKVVRGIGRPSTQAKTIEGLKKAGLLKANGKFIDPTENGIALIQMLPKALKDVAFTAELEAKLDLIAQQGGMTTLEQETAQKIKRLADEISKMNFSSLAAGFKAAAGKSGSSKAQSFKGDNLSTRTPSPKQIELAESVAQRKGLELPEGYKTDATVCSAFLDKALAPSEKQISFAQKIAKDKGLTIPDETLKKGSDLSKWIDSNK